MFKCYYENHVHGITGTKFTHAYHVVGIDKKTNRRQLKCCVCKQTKLGKHADTIFEN